MEPIISYFAAMPSIHRAGLLAGGILFSYLLEGAVPLFRFKTTSPDYNRGRHLGLNLFFTATTIVVNFVLAFVLVKTSDWAVANTIGLLLLDLVGAGA